MTRCVLHLTGTQYFQPLVDDALSAARDLWNQEIISENADVYRAEFLAVDLFDGACESGEALSADKITPQWVQERIGGRF